MGGTDAGPVTSIDANVGAPTDAGTDAPSVGSAPIDAALGGSVTSADGVLTIEIPPGALAADIGAVILDQSATKFGAVESMSDAQKCADLFKANAGKIDGILVTLPNFGDERGVANAIRWSELKVPVMFHAFNDDPKTMTIKDRRDSFCGKMSVCNNLRQYGFPTP